ncbi:MAG: aminoacyl-tRNA hydrolase [Candidatus Woesebacteria bacterium]|jgi:PTH1 family peptidyl-tRNA hydrolase
MKLIVGLGNPGRKYKQTRHNVGFMIVDSFVARVNNSEVDVKVIKKDTGTKGDSVVWKDSKKGKLEYCWLGAGRESIEVIKPMTYVNDSGHSVAYAYNKHSLDTSDLYICHDDLDLKLGAYKIQKGKGPREHKGLLSIYEKIGTKDFWHVRIGVDNRTAGNQVDKGRVSGEKYVLQKFTREELGIVEKVVKEAVDDLWKKLGIDG